MHRSCHSSGTERSTARRLKVIYRAMPEYVRRGRLVALDGLDASGKTTLADGLAGRLRARGVEVVVTNWNETTELYNLMMRLNAAGDLTPDMRCIFGGADLAARHHYVMRPALHRGATVVATKYVLSALAHGKVRGHHDAFLNRVHAFAEEPDVSLYLDVPAAVCLERKLRAGRIGFWEAGLDLALECSLEDALRRYASGELDEDAVHGSFVAFQERLRALHHELLVGRHAVVLDGTLEPAELLDAALAALDAAPLESYPSDAGRAAAHGLRTTTR